MVDKNMQNKMLMILGGRFDHDHVEEEDRTIEMQALRQPCKQKPVAEPWERPNRLILAAGQGRAVKIESLPFRLLPFRLLPFRL